MDYIRKAYGVPAKRGVRVRLTHGTPKLGTITGSAGPHLRIRMDGDDYSGIYHPTWELEYLP